MKLISYRIEGKSAFGIIAGDGVIDLSTRAKSGSLRELIADEPDALDRWGAEKPDHQLAEIEFLPPIPDPGMILCLGLNTYSHLEEFRAHNNPAAPPPPRPWVFLRSPRSITGHLQQLVMPNASPLFDYEGEIALIIGKTARHVSPEDALDHVFGYSCFNEGSIRDFQIHSPLYTSGKNFPRSGAFGPWIVTADEVGDIRKLHLTTRLNGQVVQQMDYDDLIFDFQKMISYITSFTQLEPGDVIVTGTAAGVGAMREPKLWMAPGDICEVEVSGIGTLRNEVIEAQGQDRGPVTRSDAKQAYEEAVASMKK